MVQKRNVCWFFKCVTLFQTWGNWYRLLRFMPNSVEYVVYNIYWLCTWCRCVSVSVVNFFPLSLHKTLISVQSMKWMILFLSKMSSIFSKWNLEKMPKTKNKIIQIHFGLLVEFDESKFSINQNKLLKVVLTVF